MFYCLCLISRQEQTVEKAGAGFLSLTEVIDTTSPAGHMMMQIVGSFAEFERAMLRERTRNGLLAAAARGVWRAASADDAQSSRRSNRRKLFIWSTLGKGPPPIPHGCSMCIRPPWRGCWPEAN